MFTEALQKVKDSELPRLDKRTTQTRNSILDAAVALYIEQGVDKTSISQVIELAKVGRTTFYRHFDDRDDLLNQALLRDFNAVMRDFDSVRRSYPTLEQQIEEDMLWFIEQFDRRPALGLPFAELDQERYVKTAESVKDFRKAGIACATPTYQRALIEDRLRPGVTVDNYIDWSTFVVMSLQNVRMSANETLLRSRELLRNFLVPSLIADTSPK